MEEPGKAETLPGGNLRNLKVLLAEDNEVNQLLAKGILRHWGAETKIAENGDEVLELLLTEDFDLVLMDIQMPVKSGTEAASEIRKLPDPKKKNIPIIALTANALKGEEKKYIAAGMDDFLTKPFKEADLHEVIERVLRREGSFEREINEPQYITMQSNTLIAEKLYDFDQLEEIAADSPEFIVSLASMYIDTIPATSAEMVNAAKAREWQKVSKLAHKLKSTVDSMNIYSLQTDIRSLEIDAANKVNTDQLHRTTLRVDSVIRAVAAQVKQDYNL